MPLEPAHEVQVDHKLEDGDADWSGDSAERAGESGPGHQMTF